MECPSLEDFRQLTTARGRTIARIRFLELSIQQLESEMAIKYPRNTAMRFLGDDQTRGDMRKLREDLLGVKNELTLIDGELEVLQFQKELYKTAVYRERY